jgi:hypothetical protein
MFDVNIAMLIIYLPAQRERAPAGLATRALLLQIWQVKRVL